MHSKLTFFNKVITISSFVAVNVTVSYFKMIKVSGEWNPSPEFLICCSILKRFYPKWKAFDLLNEIKYILWGWRCWRPVTSPTMVAILAAILDFTKN